MQTMQNYKDNVPMNHGKRAKYALKLNRRNVVFVDDVTVLKVIICGNRRNVCS